VCPWLIGFDYWPEETVPNLVTWNAHTGIIIELELSFANKALRQLCESSVKADRKLGVDLANELRRRVADLRAATSVQDLLIGVPRETQTDQISLDVAPTFQITFCANHNTVPKLESGAIDWSKVSRVKILGIESKNV
jgi:plasmid maintenance system killer protein